MNDLMQPKGFSPSNVRIDQEPNGQELQQPVNGQDSQAETRLQAPADMQRHISNPAGMTPPGELQIRISHAPGSAERCNCLDLASLKSAKARSYRYLCLDGSC